MNYPIILKNVLPEYLLSGIKQDIDGNWVINNLSNEGEYSFKSWGINETTKLTTLQCASIIKLKIQKFIKKDISLVRIHFNGQTSNQPSKFHRDYNEENVWTFVLFLSDNWNPDFGGDFQVYNPLDETFSCVQYNQNNGVLIPSNWPHIGKSPTSFTDELRVSVAFTFCDSEIIKDFIDKYPNCKKYIF